MSTGISDYGKNKFLPLGGTDALPSTMYLALVTDATILASNTMGDLTEPVGGYARQALQTDSSADWPTTGQGYKESRQVQFTPVSSNWVGVQHIVLCDAVSGNANIIAYRPVTGAPLTVNTGENLLSTFRLQQA